MNGDTYNIFQYSTPKVIFTFVHTDGKPVDLSAASTVTLVVLPDIMADEGPVTPVAASAATVYNATKGQVAYTFTAEQTADYGMFQVMAVIQNTDGTVYTLPEMNDMWLWIKARGY